MIKLPVTIKLDLNFDQLQIGFDLWCHSLPCMWDSTKLWLLLNSIDFLTSSAVISQSWDVTVLDILKKD